MKYPIEAVAQLVYDIMPRSTKEIAALIQADWKSAQAGMSLEQALDAAIAQDAIAGDADADRARQITNFQALLQNFVVPAVLSAAINQSELVSPAN